jgi:CheY-like chemotaxis protein
MVVASDEAIIAYCFAAMLEKQALKCSVLRTRQQALELVRNRQPDVALVT